MKKKKIIWITFPILLLFGLYFIGPQPEKPNYDLALPDVPTDAQALEEYVLQKESLHKLKPGNEAEIVWIDSTKRKTPYSILYLHGFSASKKEGDPVHRNFARHFGCNMYLSRLSDHGIDTTEALLYFTPDRFWRSAVEGLSIASKLGEKVIIMGTSSGSTLALRMAAEYPHLVHAIINMSPNCQINNELAFIANDPWGISIARIVKDGDYNITEATEEEARYWNKKYRLEAVVQLQELLETIISDEVFEKIKQPSLTLYYYKNETEQDPQVRVDAMLRMHDKLGTPPDMKQAIAFPNAGVHVIGSSLTSKDVDGVYDSMIKFATEKLKLKPY